MHGIIAKSKKKATGGDGTDKKAMGGDDARAPPDRDRLPGGFNRPLLPRPRGQRLLRVPDREAREAAWAPLPHPEALGPAREARAAAPRALPRRGRGRRGAPPGDARGRKGTCACRPLMCFRVWLNRAGVFDYESISFAEVLLWEFSAHNVPQVCAWVSSPLPFF